MEGPDPWSVLKCAGVVQDKTIINRIMLRFRPIAPKPVTGGSVSGESMFGNKSLVVTGKRTKRKYVRVCKKNNRKRRILEEAKEDNDGKKGSVTLQLMPEKADLEKSMVVERPWVGGDDLDRTVVNNYQFQEPPSLRLKLKKMVAADDVAVMGLSDLTAFITSHGKRMTVVESWVTVESVTDTCMAEGEMGSCTDVEKKTKLEKDTCPGFLSDGLNRVFWVNNAYKNLVGGADGERAEATVRLVVKDGFKFPHGAFSCRVGLQYGDGNTKKKHSKMVPCDVWKMSYDGFAWRLDVRAALSLGL